MPEAVARALRYKFRKIKLDTEKENYKKEELLLIFVRNPEKGKVKTRLAAEIGDDAALRIYEFLLKHTSEITKHLPVDKEVHYSEETEENDVWENAFFYKKEQKGADLGERMEFAFKKGFEAGYKRIIIIGSDLFDLKEKDIKSAFSALRENPYIIGPALDGGYYLLGMHSLNRKLFRNKNWGTETVLEETLADLKNENIFRLPERNDIDTPEDLKAHPELENYLKNNKK